PLGGGLYPYQQQVPPPIYQWVSQLGSQTQIRSDGLVQLNLPLIETLVRYREGVVPVLYQWMSMAQNPVSPHLMVMVESLYLAQRLAEEGVSNVSMLYGITKHWNHTPHPLVQIYLAGFYRKLNAPETLGPLFQLLMKNALQPGPPIPPAFDPQEEIGGAILDLIARKAAEETWKKFQFPPPSGRNLSTLPPQQTLQRMG
ncbi:MAG: hypothetical protein K2X66_08135, partial [Cyanobacteria bacterium]|nr:hypothetical protein [Cyanobacteriota bacterium]